MAGGRILIIGGGGFIGRHLIMSLKKNGWQPVLTARPGSAALAERDDGLERLVWDGRDPDSLIPLLTGCTAVVNLAGENVGQFPWTPARKERILASRRESASALAEAVVRGISPPPLLIQASAAGYFGDRADEILAEDAPPGSGFLATVCQQWEAALAPAAERTRVIFLRFAVVLGTDGGILPRLRLPFRLGLGGHPGSGRQWLPWLHVKDAVAAIEFLLRHSSLSGPVHLAAPEASRASDFYRTIARHLHRPCRLHPPALLLRLLLGDLARDLLLASCRLHPQILIEQGFFWSFPDLDSALADLLDA